LAVGKGLEMRRLKFHLRKSSIVYFSVFFGILVGGMIILSAVAGEGYMSKVRKLVEKTSIENYVGPFLTLGFLSQTPPIIEHATVGFELGNFVVDPTPENGWTGDEYFANVINQCIFHSYESFEPLCVICKLKDVDGNVIGASSVESFGEQYTGSSTLYIDLEPDPENPLSLDVQKAHEVEIDICQQKEGCTPGYWRQEQHFDSFQESPKTPIAENDEISTTTISAITIIRCNNL